MSKQITQKLATEIKDEIEFLTGRAKQVFKIPLNAEEIENAWNATIDIDVREAFHTLDAKGYDVNGHRIHDPYINIQLDNTEYCVRFHKILLARPYNDNLHILRQAWPLGPEKWTEFAEWVQNVGAIDAEFREAHEVVCWLLDTCGSVGQLIRAMPELATFMPKNIQTVLREQRRASTMPYDWASYPREKVERAQYALSKAFMLPDPGDMRRGKWSQISCTWATRVATKA
jgi:hypothetical protein